MKSTKMMAFMLAAVMMTGAAAAPVYAADQPEAPNNLLSIDEEALDKEYGLNSVLKQKPVNSNVDYYTTCTYKIDYSWNRETKKWEKNWEEKDTVKKGRITQSYYAYNDYHYENGESTRKWTKYITKYTRNAKGYVTESKKYTNKTYTGKTKYSYNKKYQTTKQVDYDADNKVTSTYITEYDKNGRTSKTYYYNGSVSKKNLQNVTTYTYTKNGYTKKVVEKNGSGKKTRDTTYTYNGKNQRIKEVYNYYDAEGKKSETNTRTYSYYKNGNRKQEKYVSSSGSRSTSKYNQDGYITSYVRKWENGKETEYYTYDSKNRLKKREETYKSGDYGYTRTTTYTKWDKHGNNTQYKIVTKYKDHTETWEYKNTYTYYKNGKLKQSLDMTKGDGENDFVNSSKSEYKTYSRIKFNG